MEPTILVALIITLPGLITSLIAAMAARTAARNTNTRHGQRPLGEMMEQHIAQDRFNFRVMATHVGISRDELLLDD